MVGVVAFVHELDRSRKLEQHLRGRVRQYARQVEALNSTRNLWLDTYLDLNQRLLGFERPQDLIEFLVEETRQRLNAESAQLFLVQGSRLRRQAIAPPRPGWLEDESYQAGEGITGETLSSTPKIRRSRPVRSNDVDEDPRVVTRYLDEYRTYLPSGRVKHLLTAPLNRLDEMFGALRVVNKLDRNNRLIAEGFSQEDEEFLSAIAAMAALSLENVRLLSESQRRFREISALYRLSQSMVTTLDQRDLLQRIVDEARAVLSNADKVSIHLINAAGDLLAEATSEATPSRSGHPPIRAGQGIAGKAIHQKATVYVPDTRCDADYQERGGLGALSMLVTPLLIEGRVIGTLSVDSRRPHAFGQDDQNLLEALATLSSNIIEKARLYYQEQLRRRQAYATLQISDAINSNLEQEQLLETVLDEVSKLVKYDSISIQLIEDQTLKVIACRGFQDPEKVMSLSFPVDANQFPNYRVLKEKQPVIVDDVQRVYIHFLQQSDVYQSANIHSWMGIPMIHRGEAIGMIAFDHHQPGYYQPEMQEIAQILVNQVATAIEKAILYRQAMQRKAMLERLVEASTGLIRHIELGDLQYYCARQAAYIFDVEDGSLYMRNEERSTIDLVASSAIPAFLWNKRLALLDGPGLTAYVAHTGEILNFGGDEYRDHLAWAGRFEPPFVEHLDYLPSRECRSLLIGPLEDSQGRNLGVLKLENKRGEQARRRFSEFEVNLHRTFSSYIGIAIERARFYQQLDEEARREARASLGYDLHEIANFVHGALKIQLEVAKEELHRDNLNALDQELERLSKAAEYVTSMLRWIYKDLLNNITVQDLGLVKSLERFAEFLNVPLQVSVVGQTLLPFKVEYALYKIGLEAIYNVRKYAGMGGPCHVSLEKNEQSFKFTMRDNGPGFDVDETLSKPDSYGLKTMQRWAKTIDSRLVINSPPGGGVLICVEGAHTDGKKTG
jgi:GAF domain-containing protein